jgi:carbonic anhydrase/acetyltransferase-like protein (isoleucine patch superfamily)
MDKMSIRTFNNLAPKIDKLAYVDEDAVVIGDVSINEHSSVFPMSVIRGDINYIKIGKYTNIQDGSILHVTHDSEYSIGGSPLIIDDYITIGHSVTLHACHIKSYCLIGMGSIILDKAIIEPYTLLGAGSLVAPNSVLEGGYLWLGSPAKKLRPLTEKELNFFSYSAKHYAKLAQSYKL